MEYNNFAHDLRSEVDDFLIYWFQKNQVDPEDFPMEMSDADWHKQFILWLNN